MELFTSEVDLEGRRSLVRCWWFVRLPCWTSPHAIDVMGYVPCTFLKSTRAADSGGGGCKASTPTEATEDKVSEYKFVFVIARHLRGKLKHQLLFISALLESNCFLNIAQKVVSKESSFG
jgi:hypothetical protein